jgi:hypothetical protein
MKKILLLLTILISSNVFADWVLIGTTNEDDNFYIDPETITKKGNKVRHWRKANLGKTESGIRSSRVYQEIDCEQKTVLVLSMTFFSEIDFQGAMNNTANPKPIADYIAPNTVNDAFMDYVCK